MKFNIVIEPRAIADAQAAIDYYDGKQIDLGKKFNKELDKYIDSLSENPFYQLRYKDYRALPLKKFPYLILFFIDEKTNTVFITAIFNTHQDPEKYPQ